MPKDTTRVDEALECFFQESSFSFCCSVPSFFSHRKHRQEHRENNIVEEIKTEKQKHDFLTTCWFRFCSKTKSEQFTQKSNITISNMFFPIVSISIFPNLLSISFIMLSLLHTYVYKYKTKKKVN